MNKDKKTKIILLSVIAVMSVVIIALSAMIILDKVSSAGGTGKGGGDYDEIVETATDKMYDKWKEEMDNFSSIEIYHTRVIEIKPEHNNELFLRGLNAVCGRTDLKYIVEFDVYSDYYMSDPYYYEMDNYSCVLIFEDGAAQVVEKDLFSLLGRSYYNFNWSDVVKKVTDLGDTYNKTLKV